MNRLFTLTFAAVLLLAATAFAQPLTNIQGNANVTGSWDMTIESPQGQRTALLIIKQEGDKLAGSIKSPRGELPLDEITVKGSDISFSFKLPAQGQEIVLSYKGKVEKESMKGDADFGGMATGTWSAVPHKESPTSASSAGSSAATSAPGAGSAAVSDISGTWNFAVETLNGTGTPVITFKQNGETLSGTYKGQLGEAPITGTFKGSDLKFSFKVNFQGQEYDVVYTGKVEGKDAMKGKVRLGDLGEGDWTAKKKQ